MFSVFVAPVIVELLGVKGADVQKIYLRVCRFASVSETVASKCINVGINYCM